jgi:hypothetical protein
MRDHETGASRSETSITMGCLAANDYDIVSFYRGFGSGDFATIVMSAVAT